MNGRASLFVVRKLTELLCRFTIIFAICYHHTKRTVSTEILLKLPRWFITTIKYVKVNIFLTSCVKVSGKMVPVPNPTHKDSPIK